MQDVTRVEIKPGDVIAYATLTKKRPIWIGVVEKSELGHVRARVASATVINGTCDLREHVRYIEQIPGYGMSFFDPAKLIIITPFAKRGGCHG